MSPKNISRREMIKDALTVALVLMGPGLHGCDDTASGGDDGGPDGSDPADVHFSDYANTVDSDGGTPDVVDVGPYTYDGPPGPDDLFNHGIASGDPLTDAVILWTRVSPPTNEAYDVYWEVAQDASFEEIVNAGWFQTAPQRDFTVKVDATGLKADTSYAYRFRCMDKISPIGQMKTLPGADVTQVRLAVVSCSNLAYGYFHSYRKLALRDDIDFVLHLGDYIYEYGSGEYGDVRPHEPSHETYTLDDYRQRYSQYRRDQDLQALHQKHPMIIIWDDHESANDSWIGGAENHSDTEGDWYTRMEASVQAWYEWIPIREQEHGNIYRSFNFGGLLDLHMLDTRLVGRDESTGATNTEPLDPNHQILGEEQEGWLFDKLNNSEATWNILGQQVMMSQMQMADLVLNPDQWDGYASARKRFLHRVQNDGLSNLVVLTGDIHTSWANLLVQDEDVVGLDPTSANPGIAVEFVTPAVTSPGLDSLPPSLMDLMKQFNPHVQYAEVTKRGYIIVDVTEERVQADWYHFEDVETPGERDEYFAAGYSVESGLTRLLPQSAPSQKLNDSST